jgi:hypothetical protein
MKIIKRGEIMEHENNYASKGLSGTALGLSIGALAGGVLSGNFGNILGGGNATHCCNEDHLVNRYELGLQQEIEAKNARISLLESNIYTDTKLADIYERLNTKFEARCNTIEAELCQQRVYNATNTATLNCIGGQVASLLALTKTVIPIGNVCPEPMPAYNSWTAPTTTAGA